MRLEMIESDSEELLDDEFLFYSHLYSSITVVFAMAVLSKFFCNEIQFGFRSFLTLLIVFIGEPLCHFLIRGPSGVVVFGIGCMAVYSILPSNDLPVRRKAVLVTGCDSGIGYALAQQLDRSGVDVYAGCLSVSGPGAQQLRSSCSDRLRLIQLDVTNEKQIADARDFVESHAQTDGLWGVVNIAGVCYVADLEMTTDQLFRHIVNVNLLGTVAVTRAFLPLIRETKGRIVNMSSISGRVAIEHFGAYNVSKSGIEMFSDVLRLEMKKWDVRVCIIEPQGCMSADTLAAHKVEIWGSLDERTKLVYGEAYLNKLYENMESSVPRYPRDVSPVILAVRSALFSTVPRARYTVGLGPSLLMRIYFCLPTWLSDRLSMALSTTSRDAQPAKLLK